MNGLWLVYITGGALVLFLYGVLLGSDNAKVEDFGAMVPLVLLWPVFVIPVGGILLGAGLKKLWRKS